MQIENGKFTKNKNNCYCEETQYRLKGLFKRACLKRRHVYAAAWPRGHVAEIKRGRKSCRAKRYVG